MIEKYGKSLHDILDIKQIFFENDTSLLKNNLHLAEIAKKQSKRKHCKNCSNKLTFEALFTKHEIEYYLCDICNHLNGEFDDTIEFAKAVYVDEITSYSENYSASDYNQWINRVKSIYEPKAEFLLKCLENDNEGNKMSLIDLGAGSGHLLKALINYGFKDIRGYEVSSKQVKLANIMLNEKKVEEININSLVDVISNTNAEIISMIGVLEHLTNPRAILDAISKNKSVKYCYISLPLFSYSVFFEMNNEEFFNRQLSGGHTHLYTKESINYFCDEFNFEIIGKWNFGADAMDLYRFNLLKLNKRNVKVSNLFSEKILNILDEIQLVFDKAEFSSEVHMLFKVR